MLGLNLGINKGVTKNKYRTLAKSCGMLTATTDLKTDRVGITSRAAVRGVEIIGDGNTYLELENNINITNDFSIKFKFLYVGGSVVLGDDTGTQSAIIISPTFIRYRDEISTHQADTPVSGVNEFEIILSGGNIEILKNGVSVLSESKAAIDFRFGRIFSYGSTSFRLEGCIYELEINNYTLDTTNRNNVYQLISKDKSESILLNQFLTPAQPTQENIEVVSMADSYGYTVANGTQYYDVAGIKQIPISSVIPNYKDGVTSTAYVDGVHPKGTFLGRCKYDFTSDGTTIQLADNYHQIAKYDTTRILTESDGTPKILTLENIALVTNNQLYYNQDLKIGFFKESLTGDCHEKANKMFKQRVERLSDSDLVQLSDSEGEKLYSLV